MNQKEHETIRYSKTQKELADNTLAIITQNICRHITIRELADTLHVSPTLLKTCFRRVYGMPVYSFAKTQRMKTAARLLLETDDSILKIAGQLGYENGSKFANAFHSVIGVTPSRYRKQGRMRREDEIECDHTGRK